MSALLCSDFTFNWETGNVFATEGDGQTGFAAFLKDAMQFFSNKNRCEFYAVVY